MVWKSVTVVGVDTDIVVGSEVSAAVVEIVVSSVLWVVTATDKIVIISSNLVLGMGLT